MESGCCQRTRPPSRVSSEERCAGVSTGCGGDCQQRLPKNPALRLALRATESDCRRVVGVKKNELRLTFRATEVVAGKGSSPAFRISSDVNEGWALHSIEFKTTSHRKRASFYWICVVSRHVNENKNSYLTLKERHSVTSCDIANMKRLGFASLDQEPVGGYKLCQISSTSNKMADPFQTSGQPPQYPTPCEEYRSLWCFILGNREPFKVALPLNIVFDLDDLKEVIHIKGIDTTKSTVLPKDLILWKVCLLSEPHDFQLIFCAR